MNLEDAVKLYIEDKTRKIAEDEIAQCKLRIEHRIRQSIAEIVISTFQYVSLQQYGPNKLVIEVRLPESISSSKNKAS